VEPECAHVAHVYGCGSPIQDVSFPTCRNNDDSDRPLEKLDDVCRFLMSNNDVAVMDSAVNLSSCSFRRPMLPRPAPARGARPVLSYSFVSPSNLLRDGPAGRNCPRSALSATDSGMHDASTIFRQSSGDAAAAAVAACGSWE